MEEVLDVAIVGGGIAGTYSAYRLRRTNQKIGLFECSDRIGGRMYTYRLPCCPTLNLELGAMRFVPHYHKKLDSLVKEMGLPVVPFPNNGRSEKPMTVYYFRGKHFDDRDIAGGQVPYALTEEERRNQHRPWEYYFEKLTGVEYDESKFNSVEMKMADGTSFNNLTLKEAVEQVASQEGLEYLKPWGAPGGEYTASYFKLALVIYCSQGVKLMSLEDGMSSLPQRLLQAFEDSSNTHKTHYNHKLVSITKEGARLYRLRFQLTSISNDDILHELPNQFYETVARRVVLAIPLPSLDSIQWPPLQEPRFQNARKLTTNIGLVKVFLIYNTPWWQVHSPGHYTDSISDQSYDLSHDYGHRDGSYALLATYTNNDETGLFRTLQGQGETIRGSAPGDMRVSVALYELLIDELSTSYQVPKDKIPEPIGGVAKFWDDLRYGRGLSHWSLGSLEENPVDSIIRPSLEDDVVAVGADLASKKCFEWWSEGALHVVDEVLEEWGIVG